MKHVYVHAQLCPTLCDSIDCSPPGSSVLGIFQARIVEWFAISHSRGPPDPQIEHAALVSPAFGRPDLYHWHLVIL